MTNWNDAIPQFTKQTRNYAANFNEVNNMLLDNTRVNKEEIAKKADKLYVDEQNNSFNNAVGAVNAEMALVKNDVDALNTGMITVNEEIEQVKLSVSNGKTLIAGAITDKGIPASASDTFSEMQQKIYQIQQGEESPITLNYSFHNDKIGNGSGVISLDIKQDFYKGVYDIFWADTDKNKLSEYEAICKIDLTTKNNAGFITTPFYCIPGHAKKIIAVKDGATMVAFDIPAHKSITILKKYSFGLLSDIHINPEPTDKSNSILDFTTALDYFKNTQNADMVLVSGDVVTYGTMAEMIKFRELVDAQTLPVYCCRGNHDTYAECTIGNYTKYIDAGGLYYEKTINNDVYIFFGMVMEDTANPFSDYSLEWLKERLEVHRNERVFLLEHVFVEPVGNAGGLYPFSTGILNSEGTTGRKFRDLVSHYRNVIHFSGHSHLDFSLERLSNVANCSERTDIMCHRVHIPSGCKPRQNDIDTPDTSDNTYTNNPGGEGYTVDVYDNFIILKGVDIPTRKLKTHAQYIIDTTPITIEADNKGEVIPPPVEYEFVSDFTTFVPGSLNSDGTDKPSSNSQRSDFIELNDNPNPGLLMPSGIQYLRICIYDSQKNFIEKVVHDYEEGVRIPSGTIIGFEKPAGAAFIKFKSIGDIHLIQFNGSIAGGPTVPQIIPNRPPTVPIPPNKTYPTIDEGAEPADKYEKAKWKAINFIKRQFNGSNFFSPVTFDMYTTTQGLKLIRGKIDGLENAAVIQNKYISLDADYNEAYSGEISGKWHRNLKHPEKYRVDVYLITDTIYFVDSCDLKDDNTWKTKFLAKEGIKHIELVYRENGMPVEYAYPLVDNYKAKLYVLGDVEYEQETCNIYVKDNKYYFFARTAYKNANWMAKIYNLDDEIVGLTAEYSNIKHGQLPSSYLIPKDDAQYDKEGNSAQGQHGYLLNSRSFIYDVGLSLLVFAKERDFEVCKQLMNRMKAEQKANGSFNFSYDNYIGQLYEDYIRTGSIGWLVWGMCYYALESGDTSYNEIIEKAGQWILSQQVLDAADFRYGLLRGGFGEYDRDYVYKPVDIEWCSTEHNCSALQAVKGLYNLLQDEKYNTCAALMTNSITNTLYDAANGRFYQGCSIDGVDDAWSIDCLTWAGKTVLSVGDNEKALACKESVMQHFRVDDTTILVSSDKEYYNNTYSLPTGITVSGFKPYHIGYNNPPRILWTEGTLGAIALFKGLGLDVEATRYIDEMIKLQDCTNSTGGLIYTTETHASIPWEFHVWESVVSSCWLYLVLTDVSILF